jgi:hypothetical protein
MRGDHLGAARAVPSSADHVRSRWAWGIVVVGSLAAAVLGARSPQGWAGFTAAAVVTVVAAGLLGGLGPGIAAAFGVTIAFWIGSPDGDPSMTSSDHLLGVIGIAVAAAAIVLAIEAVRAGRLHRAREAERAERLTQLDHALAEHASSPPSDREEFCRLAAQASGAVAATVVADEEPHGTASGRGPEAQASILLPARTTLGRRLRLVFEDRAQLEANPSWYLDAVARRCLAALERHEHRSSTTTARDHEKSLRQATDALVSAGDPAAVVESLRTVLVPRVADVVDVRLARGVSRPGLEDPPPARASDPPGAVSVQVSDGSRVLGSLVAARLGGEIDDAGRALLAALAPVVGRALTGAVRRQQLDQTLHTLGRSLIPESLLSVDGLQLASRFLPAATAEDVGGDFYDAVRGHDGAVTLIIGDVQGKGVEAATITAVARHTLRAGALAGDSPAAMLSRLNEVLLYGQAERSSGGVPAPTRFVTAAVASLAPTTDGFDLAVARGGQPPPVLVRSDGHVEQLSPAGPLLGVSTGVSFEELTTSLDVADTLILYTDGVTEQRRTQNLFDELQLGLLVRNRLAAVDAEEIAQLIQDTVLIVTSKGARDDVAVLVACVRPRGGGTSPLTA